MHAPILQLLVHCIWLHELMLSVHGLCTPIGCQFNKVKLAFSRPLQGPYISLFGDVLNIAFLAHER